MVYVHLLRVPRLGRLLAAMVLARLPVGINPLAIVLFVSAERGGFATAGLVVGALALGSGVAAPLAGRAVDRFGRGLLVPIALGHGAALIALVALVPTAVPAAALCAIAFVGGGLLPPVSSVMRALYPRLLRGEPQLLPAAFALDAVATDLLFAGGPLLVAAIVAVASPQGALVLSAAVASAGCAAFVALIPAEVRGEPAAGRPGGGWGFGALADPGIRILTATMLPLGVSFGAIEVVIPAFVREHGATEAAGLLLAVWSVASAAGGFWYGFAVQDRSLAVHRVAVAALALTTAPLLLSSSPLMMALLLIPAGLPVGPLVAARNQLVGALAPRGVETEAYTWVLTALVAGMALGAALGGVLIDVADWRAATAAAVAAAVVGAVGALGGHATLRCALGGPALTAGAGERQLRH
jgi:MFS family permease